MTMGRVSEASLITRRSERCQSEPAGDAKSKTRETISNDAFNRRVVVVNRPPPRWRRPPRSGSVPEEARKTSATSICAAVQPPARSKRQLLKQRAGEPRPSRSLVAKDVTSPFTLDDCEKPPAFAPRWGPDSTCRPAASAAGPWPGKSAQVAVPRRQDSMSESGRASPRVNEPKQHHFVHAEIPSKASSATNGYASSDSRGRTARPRRLFRQSADPGSRLHHVGS